MKDHSDYIGRIEPISRSAARIDCVGCVTVISDDVPAFVYFDVSVAELFILCEKCHRE